MITEKRTLDINARVTEFAYSINTHGESKTLDISFKNLNYGIITAIRMVLKAKDSFGDTVLFGDVDEYEIKRADLNIKPGNKASLSVEVGQYDIKIPDLKITQIVYSSGEIFDVKNPEIVEYEIERFSGNWSNEDHFDRYALDYINEYNSDAICIPSSHPNGWICSCGYLNLKDEAKCRKCSKDRDTQLNKYSKNELKSAVERRERKEIEEQEERERLKKLEEEKRAKRNKRITIGIVVAVAVIVIIIIAIVLYNNHVYGLSKEDAVAYELAQDNYKKIDSFSLGLSLDVYDKTEEYYIDDFNKQRNRMDEAERDKDYLYSRGMYEASALLYKLITDQYPEKYRETYEKLSQAHEGNIFNDIGIMETLYIKMSTSNSYFDRQEEIDDAIDNLEEYMEKTVFNPDKVKYTAPSMPNADYSNVYGISMGILLYDDGNIMYIGEITDDQANGYGRAYYSSKDGGGIMCEGSFESGRFIDGEHYGHGDEDNLKEIQEKSFSGECMMVSGLKNTQSSESVANKKASDDARDKQKASACVRDYVNTVVKKQNGCEKAEWIDIPEIDGSFYSYSCTLTMTDGSTRKGTITVYKDSDGTFTAEGIDLD